MAAPTIARRPWWQRGVIYQIYPRSFQDASGDGVGDLRGIVRRLPYLRWLGVDAIWLSPFYPSPMADLGYDVADYCDVDPLFGTLADFHQLVAAAHAQGLRVIVDAVLNHSSEQHPWFLASRSSKDNPFRSWYTWRDPAPDGGPPNNWIGAFGGPAWTWDSTSEQYYLHAFLPEQPDLSWRHDPVREAMKDVLRFWLELGVDGFRLDAISRLMKDPELRDNPISPEAAARLHKAMGDYGTQLHLHDQNHPEIHGILRELRAVLDGFSTPEDPRVSLGEAHIFDWSELARYHGTELDELHLLFNFGLLKAPWSADAVRDLLEAYEAALPAGAWPAYVIGNHDEPRAATRLGPAGARLATLLLLTLRGTPTLYYGDELGLRDVPIPPDRALDPWGSRVPGLNLGRDPARTPMPWDTSPNAGFCPEDAEPWLPLGADAARLNVAAERDDPASALTFTRALLRLRREHPALSQGDFRVDGAHLPDDCLAFWREAASDRLLVVLSFASEPREVPLPIRREWRVLLSTHQAPRNPTGGPLLLQPCEGCVLQAIPGA